MPGHRPGRIARCRQAGHAGRAREAHRLGGAGPLSDPGAPPDAALKEALRAALERLARAGRTITYRELAALVPVPAPHAIHTLTLALEDLVREDYAAGRPLLAALAVSRGAKGIPGRGFFHLLAELGRTAGPAHGPEAEAVHAAELARVFARWGTEP